jgi:hypothetical protein
MKMKSVAHIFICTLIIPLASCITIPRQGGDMVWDYDTYYAALRYYEHIRNSDYDILWNMASWRARSNYGANKARFRILMRSKYGGSRKVSYGVPRIIAQNRYIALTENRVQHYMGLSYVCERIVWVQRRGKWYFSDIRIGCSNFPTIKQLKGYYR